MTADVKSMNIKNRTYYVFDDMINIEEFDTSLLKGRTKTLAFTILDKSQ